MNPIGSVGKVVWRSVAQREPERTAVWLEIESSRFEDPPSHNKGEKDEDAALATFIDMC